MRGLSLLFPVWLLLMGLITACGDNTATPASSAATTAGATTTAVRTTTAATTALPATIAPATIPVAAATTSAASGTAVATTYPLTITDQTGTAVTIVKKPERIACVSDQCLDILLELGLKPVSYPGYLLSYPSFYLADPQLYGNEVASFGKIANNGSAFSPEDIIASKPDLVIGSAYSTDLREPLKNVAPLYLTNVIGLQSILDANRAVGIMTDHQTQGEASLKKFQDRLASYAAKSPKNLSTVLLANYNTAQTLGAKSAAGDLLSRVTLYPWDIANLSASGWGQISLEKLLEVNPDTMLIGGTTSSKQTDAEALTKLGDNSFWKEMKAVQAKKVYAIDAQYMLGRGTIALSRLLDQSMIQLYPEVFPQALP